jgi:hypothetical protein
LRKNGEGTRVARWTKGDPRVLALWCGRGKRRELRRGSQGPQAAWGPKARIFISDNLPWLEEAIKKIFPEANRQLCVLHAVRAALNKARKKDREALAEISRRFTGPKPKRRRRKPCKTCENGGARSIPRSWSVGKPKLVPFLRFYTTPSPSEGIPYHQPSGAVGQRSKEANQSGRGLL